MTSRHPNPRLVKIHRSYTVEEIALLLEVHKNTVRAWLKLGLPVCDNKRPTLILGRDLAHFLQVKRSKNKQHCQTDEMYCLRCRAPRKPAGNMVEYEPKTEKIGNLLAICPVCGAMMNRRASWARIRQFVGILDITFPQALRHISDSTELSLNSDLTKGC